MARESTIIVGSGINPLKQDLVVSPTTNQRHLGGTAVVVLNTEDNSAGTGGEVTQITMASGVPAQLPTTPLSYRRAVSVRNFNPSTGTLYVGFTSGVTTLTGFPLEAGESLPLEVNGGITIWGISNVSIDVRIIELA